MIIKSWSETALENIKQIVGIAAPTEFLNKIVYIALTHDPRILKIYTATAYHSGINYFVEVDIMLDGDLKLVEAHDIGESLQHKLESLPQVDRAFVHLDYETDYKQEHLKQRSESAMSKKPLLLSPNVPTTVVIVE